MMLTLPSLAVLLGAGAASAAGDNQRERTNPVEFFEKQVRPVLAAHCLDCHGPKRRKAGLRLDSREAMLSGGDSGPAMVVGHPEESRLIKAVAYNEAPRMPPAGRLKPEEIEILTKWIKDGAHWPTTDARVRPATPTGGLMVTAKDREFWSFRPISDPPVPPVRDAAWPRNSIDRFILARLEAEGLRPVAPADRRVWLRRVSFDLVGLPPTPEEVDAYLADNSAEAEAKVVDRLLASPHYGERQARHWLDVARYGEDQAHTFNAKLYPHGWRYRDWLINAFNRDLPYDRFVMEQIAADRLGDPKDPHRLAALGFFSLGPVYYGDRNKLDQYDDRIDTLTRGFLGLTVACARCHDHKFDPIPTRDYYGLAGVFASTEFVEVPLVSAEEVERAEKARTEEEKKKKAPPKYPLVHALKDASKGANMKVLLRGNIATPGEEAPRRFLSVLGADDAAPFADGSGRLELARAVASADNPLTARVMVNRIWLQHFGKGLVRTPSNFGALGERPTHPELLDHLARRFIDGGWSIKKLHREIVLSATYRLSAQADAVNAERDADNRLLGRMNRRRLEVEAWRDALLAVSGRLDPQTGGPSADLNSPDNRRRTLYGFVSRHELNPLLRLFDFPDPNITADQRTVTTVPLQQLFVLNSEFMVRSAKALAERMIAAGPDDAARVRAAYRVLFGREPGGRESAVALAFLSAPNPAGAKLSRWEQYCQALLAGNEFLYLD
jgi:mono/diheme cytochrome c family protein